MTSDSLVIVGCGGFGREVHDVIDAINAETPRLHLLGYVDDAPSDVNIELVERRGSRVLGTTDWLRSAANDVLYVIGIGTGSARRTIDTSLSRHGRRAATLVHPTATHGFDVTIGAGSVVCAGVRLTTNIRIGRHVHLNLNTTVGHDVVLGDYVTVNPLSAISGGVRVEPDCMLGTTSSVLQNLLVGRGSTVGAGACVVRDVQAGVTVKGVPAR